MEAQFPKEMADIDKLFCRLIQENAGIIKELIHKKPESLSEELEPKRD